MVDDPHALRVSPDGATVFVTGYSQGDDFYADYATVAYDVTTGAQRWVARYNGPGSGYDNAADLAVSPDGSVVVVTGNSDSSGPDSAQDYATVAYEVATGAQRWASTYDDPLHSYDYATIVRVSPNGDDVFVSGYAGASISFDYATVAYDMVTGTQEWVSTYNGPGDNFDGPGDLVVSPAGDTVFVTGGSYGSGSGSDYATVVYDAATGAQEDVSRIGTAGSDGAGAMAISPDGSRLYVTGVMAPSSQDFGTLAYEVLA
jgi:WD40 repeat protein